MTRENDQQATKLTAIDHRDLRPGAGPDGPQTREDGPQPTAARDGYGWIVTCPKCERNYPVGRPQIMDGSWRRCPFCRETTGAEAANGGE